MAEIVYSQSIWVWSTVERLVNTVVGDWEIHVALLYTESVLIDYKNEVLVSCISQWGVDTIMP